MLVSIPLKKWLFVLEWKSIPMEYSEDRSGTSLKEAKLLAQKYDGWQVSVFNAPTLAEDGGFLDIDDWILPVQKEDCEEMDDEGVEMKEEDKKNEQQQPLSIPRQLYEYVQTSSEIENWKRKGYHTITPMLVIVV